ncbi:MAG: gamma carbonic anhydrase family protein [Deltaproteobacteria bacterium]|nr:gamma carbonic anhydrase family protein [Deltaproteobacteria bacterium]
MVLRPEIDDSVFIAEGVRIYGDVRIGAGSSLWFNAVIRGDEGPIVIGRDTNIQDNVVIHSDLMTGTTIGDNVTIGHCAVIRGCTIEDNVMVGMNATVMSNAVIGEGSIIGANSFIPYNATYPAHSLIIGSPARSVRVLREDERGNNAVAVLMYRQLSERYRTGEIAGYRRHADDWKEE